MITYVAGGAMFFFFKRKTAYEMRISDWSADGCSSDLDDDGPAGNDEVRIGDVPTIGLGDVAGGLVDLRVPVTRAEFLGCDVPQRVSGCDGVLFLEDRTRVV